MSRKTGGIILGSVFVLAAVTLILIWYVGRDTSTPPQEQQGTELVEMLPTENTPESADPDQTGSDPEAQADLMTEEYRFLLVDDDNYVTVYSMPEREIYEYTDVILDVLPEDLQTEIQRGKYIKDEEELYNFLENYTS
jgi:hypothetical protein